MKGSPVVLTMFFVLVVSGYITYMFGSFSPSQERRSEVERTVEKKQLENLEKQFEDLLNRFLTTMSQHSLDYRRQRKIITRLVKPVNLRNKHYIHENYKVMQNLMPGLQDQMGKAMAEFGNMDEDVKALLENQPEDTRMKILNKWEEVKKEQAGMYVEYFTSEQEKMKAYETLMAFYNSRRHVMEVDAVENRITFQRKEDTLQEKLLLNKLSDLASKQKDLFEKK